MKALTIRQPWASLIAESVKRIETRSWSTSYRGPLAIHAAARKVNQLTLGDWHCDPRYRTEPRVPAEPRMWRSLTQPGDLFGTHESRVLPLGAVVATCTIVDVVPIVGWSWATPLFVESADGKPLHLVAPNGGEVVKQLIEDQRPFGDFTPNRFAWLLSDIEKVDPPVPARGRQGLWEWQPESIPA